MGKHTSSKGTSAAKQKAQQQQGSQVQEPTGEYSEDKSGNSYDDDMAASGDKTSNRQSNFGGGSQR